MACSHISENEVLSDPAAFLSRVRAGEEVIVEAEGIPIAVVRAPEPRGRRISELIALADARAKELGFEPVMDEGFKADLEEIIRDRKPRDMSQWE